MSTDRRFAMHTIQEIIDLIREINTMRTPEPDEELMNK